MLIAEATRLCLRSEASLPYPEPIHLTRYGASRLHERGSLALQLTLTLT